MARRPILDWSLALAATVQQGIDRGLDPAFLSSRLREWSDHFEPPGLRHSAKLVLLAQADGVVHPADQGQRLSNIADD